jgi:4-hydroxy-3-polyprenylbenzoate decarboxylase
MAYRDLRDFLRRLEEAGELVRIRAPVSAELEITEIADRVMKGPAARNKALWFENVDGKGIPVVINLFGTPRRMAWALGVEDLEDLRRRLEALLRPELPQGVGEALERLGQVLGALRSIGLGPGGSPARPVRRW